MNKNKFRIVFNKNRGQMMAVAESASAHSASSRKAASGQTTLTTVAVGLLLGGALSLVSLTATAQVVANTTAPANQQAQVTTTASGVAQVNIQTAVGGVSRNRYTQFDVGGSGVILNNSPVNSNTKLAGWVAGNNNLASGSASIILNEVNSPNSTQIRGFIEVAGQKAEVIVANPSGIAVNGGGFINASAATLTTGTPQFSGNTLTGYQVNGGTITVSGSGLDTATAGITTLQAQKIMLQGGVWAQDLRVLGDNSASTANAVAIDVAAIGGMYANKITILANGLGAGVNNAGVLQANSGSFTLSADGTLTNTGTLDSSATTRINATTVNNSTAGAIYGGSVAIAATTLNNAATSATATAPVIAARDTTGRVDIGVQTLGNQEGALIYSAGSLNIGGSLDGSGQASGRATTVTNNSATLEAAGNVAITTQTLANTYSTLSYRTEVDPTTPALPGSADCGTDCWHTWVDTYYRAVAIEGPNGAAVIRSGADIALNASTSATNSSSKIQASGTLNSTGAALNSYGIDLTTQVATHRDHTVLITYMVNGLGCNFMGGGCHSERRWSTSYSTDLIARPQTIGPATAQSRTTSASTTAALPNSALFKTSSSNSYLIQTDPRFTSKQIWLSSDYMLSLLRVDPDVTQKRMGDGFYEQRLINEQVAQLTGYARLANYASDEAQYEALMSAGVTAASSLKLRVGIALTAEQVAQLTSDMVWLVQREVTLPDGSKQKVLVPQVYAVARAGDLSDTGALLAGGVISGNVLNLNAVGDITNTNGSTMAGRELVSMTAANVRNLAGRIQGKDVQLNASQDIENIGGGVIAQNSLTANAGRDLIVRSTTQDSQSAGNSAPASKQSGGGLLGGFGGAGGDGSAKLTTSSTDVSRFAGLYVTADAGTLLASAGRDVQLVGAILQSKGSTEVTAVRDIRVGTVTTSAKMDATLDSGNYNRTSKTAEVGSTLQSAGNTTLTAGKNITARAADVQATGDLTVTAGADVSIESGIATNDIASSRVAKNSGFMSSSTRTNRESTSTSTAIASNLGGKNVTITSGTDLGVKGSNVTADQDVTLTAANNISVYAATNTQKTTRYSALSESGLMNSGDTGASFGTRDQSTDTKSATTSAAASTIGSVGGNVNITAGKTYTQKGADIVAAGNTAGKGNVNILAQKLDIQEAREAFTTSTEQKFSQTGVTLAIQNSAVQGAQTVQAMDQSMMKTKSARMKALGAASAAMAAKEAMSGNMSEVTASLTFGTSESESKTSFTSNTARGSSVNAAGNVTLKATGAGKDSNLTIQGSSVKAGDTTTLEADNEVNLLAAANTTTQTSSQKSSSASAGISASSGKDSKVGFSGSASMASGSGNGQDVTYTNTQVSAGKKAVVKSGGNTTLKGAVVEAPIIQADIGGDLKVESLQDTSRYNESSQSASASVTIGPKSGGSLSLGATKIDSNYKSVTQQSAFRAGDGGFQVNVTGNTDLKGGAITSSQKAIDDNKNTFQTAALTTSDIQNSASFKADSFAVTVGSSGGSAGMGQDSGSASSTTKAGISGIAGNKAARTGDAETGIQKIFDATRVKDEVGAQVAITQEFGKQAPRAVANFADSQRTDLLKQLQSESDPTKRAQLSAEAQKWEEGGTYRVLMHTTLGALGGGTTGALGAGAAAVAAPLMNDLQDKLAATLEKAGLSKETAAAISKTVAQTTVLATGAALGGINSGAMALNVDANNRQLHPKEIAFLADKDRVKRYVAYMKDKGVALTEADALKALDQYGAAMADVGWTKINGRDFSTESFILAEAAKSKDFYVDNNGQGHKLFVVTADEYKNELINLKPLFSAYESNPQVKQFLENNFDKNRLTNWATNFRTGQQAGYADASKNASILGDAKTILSSLLNAPAYVKESLTNNEVGPFDSSQMKDYYQTLLKLQGRGVEAGYVSEKDWATTQRLVWAGIAVGEVGGLLIKVPGAISNAKTAANAGAVDSIGMAKTSSGGNATKGSGGNGPVIDLMLNPKTGVYELPPVQAASPVAQSAPISSPSTALTTLPITDGALVVAGPAPVATVPTLVSPSAAAALSMPVVAVADEVAPIVSAANTTKPAASVPITFQEVYQKAPAAKAEIDAIADSIAAEVGGVVAKTEVKSAARAQEKIAQDYGGDPTLIKDLARNTVIVPEANVAAVVADLKASGANIKSASASTDPLGYSGVNATVMTKAGIPAEIQVNTPAMIYAKESESVARSILGDAKYDELVQKTGIPGGQGHALYEQWRVLDPASPAAASIASESKAYYDSVRKAVAEPVQSTTPVSQAPVVQGNTSTSSFGDVAAVPVPAASAVNGVKLNNQLTSQAISDGHAFGKHIGEFSDLGIATEKQFQSHVENVINTATNKGPLSNGRTYFYDANSNTIIIKNPNAVDGGTAFRIDTTRYPNPLDYIKTLR